VPKVIEEVKYILANMPEVKEIFFDDDTLADAHEHVVELSRELRKLGWHQGFRHHLGLQRQGQCAL
jgi:ribosomal protein S13